MTGQPVVKPPVTSLLTGSEAEDIEEVIATKAPAPKAAAKGKTASKGKVAPKAFKVSDDFATTREVHWQDNWCALEYSGSLPLTAHTVHAVSQMEMLR